MKKLLSFSLITCGLICFAAEIKTVRADQFNYSTEDATAAIQQAIDSKAEKIVIPRKETPWIIHKPIQLRSKLTLLLEPGARIVAAKDKFKGRNDSMFVGNNCSDLTISGYGAVIEMRKKDYQDPEKYQKSEWRNGISLRDCSNVTIEGITVRDTGGDGIYLGASDNGACRDVKLLDVICDGNHRQGISVISAENLFLERCILINTKGTDPMAGIDFEPNRSGQRLVNIVMRNCVIANNRTMGLHFCFLRLDKDNSEVSMLFENCTVIGGEASVHVGHYSDTGPQGEIIFRNCVFSGASQNGIRLRDKSARIKTVFENCSIFNVGTSQLLCRRGRPELLTAPISMYTIYKRSAKPGNVHFKDCLVEDNHNRPFMIIADPIDYTLDGYSDITGNINLINPHGTKIEKRTKVDKFELTVNKLPIE